MNLEILDRLRAMIIEFGSPMNYWTDEQRDAFGELENRIAMMKRSA